MKVRKKSRKEPSKYNFRAQKRSGKKGFCKKMAKEALDFPYYSDEIKEQIRQRILKNKY